ncbi:hypothetical protein ABID39_001084 [Bartonella japonica]|uniref:Uncharacterized protein n=1 Tax=Bartonella japonica TaxID=357761 RepID=A0ABV2FP93_9HYPH
MINCIFKQMMRKICTKGLLLANIFIFSTVAFAGFGERKWDFARGESVAIGAHYAMSEIYRGAEYSCKAFNPPKVTFTLSYLSSSDLNNLRIVADNKNKITHDKKNKISRDKLPYIRKLYPYKYYQ